MPRPTHIFMVSFTARSGDRVIALYYDEARANTHADQLNQDIEHLKQTYADEGLCIVQSYPIVDAEMSWP